MKDYLHIQCRPNPFNPSTTIEFTLPTSGFTSLAIYNIMGQKVRELMADTMRTGTHFLLWNGKDDDGISVSSGIYISCLRTGGHTAVQRMMVVR